MRALSRSRLLLPAALAGGLVALAVGWYGLAGGADAPGASRYVEGVVGEPLRPSPLFARGHAPDEDLAALIFSGLVRIASDGTPLPDLAEEWEVTPDARTYSFRLRDDLYWHDGRRVTSADVAFTVTRIQQPGFQGPATLALRWAGVAVLTPDPRTVIVRLPEARADFLAQAALGVLPAHLLGGLGILELLETPFHRAPVGSGPLPARRALSAAGAAGAQPQLPPRRPRDRRDRAALLRERRRAGGGARRRRRGRRAARRGARGAGRGGARGAPGSARAGDAAQTASRCST